MSDKKLDMLLDKYPASVYKNRKEHLLVRDTNSIEPQTITANTRVIPGIMTNRGCCYAGCKGVVLGPIRDALIIVHGPIGCSYYAWNTRRNKSKAEDGEKNFLNYCFSTDMQDGDVVFGGMKKLRQAIKEAVQIFDPKTVMICSTCPVGLIGDDINAIAVESEKLYGIKFLSFSCEGYKGVSQSGGHHIANNGLIKHIIGLGDKVVGKYAINILGEYNIGGDGFEIERILKKIGYEIITVMTGNGTVEGLKNAHKAAVNVVQCHRSLNYIAEMLNQKYGTDWIKVNFIGIKSMTKSLRDLAEYFNDPALTARTEAVIEEELSDILPKIEEYKKICRGKTAALYVGGSRAHHYQKLLKDLGIETVLAGYEFAHRDDYEGREVIGSIKIDADSKNIENLQFEPDPEKYKVTLSKERFEKLKEEIPLNYYEGMIKEMNNGSIIVDDLNHFETEEFLKLIKPDIFFSGIKDKYVSHKSGIFSKQLHSYDYSGPYAGYNGAVNFARDIVYGMTTPAWGMITPPWKTEPLLEGTIAGGES